MPRIKLDEQPRYTFQCRIRLQPHDINYGGHLGNDALVSLVGTAQAEMFHALGLNEGDLGDGKTGLIMADLAINYKSEAFMFEELLFEIHVGDFTRAGFRLFHRVTRGQGIIALAETSLITFNYASRKVVPVPEGISHKTGGIRIPTGNPLSVGPSA